MLTLMVVRTRRYLACVPLFPTGSFQRGRHLHWEAAFGGGTPPIQDFRPGPPAWFGPPFCFHFPTHKACINWSTDMPVLLFWQTGWRCMEASFSTFQANSTVFQATWRPLVIASPPPITWWCVPVWRSGSHYRYTLTKLASFSVSPYPPHHSIGIDIVKILPSDHLLSFQRWRTAAAKSEEMRRFHLFRHLILPRELTVPPMKPVLFLYEAPPPLLSLFLYPTLVRLCICPC